jgi:hypothetical protein
MEIMFNPLRYPWLVFLISFLAMWIAARVGLALHRGRGEMNTGEREDLGMILAASLTLLGLIIGFSFSMAISRYDQRKNLEEEEANAIGTEYIRADLLPDASGEKVRRLLKSYLAERELFYAARTAEEQRAVDTRTAELQNELWNAVKMPAQASPTAIAALTVSGMNDVLNSQGYTQAAWWNHIPRAAWLLMMAIAICCNVIIGYYIHEDGKHLMRFLVMPLIVGISFLLIADIDSPRRGIIRVQPLNLIHLGEGLK